MGDPDRLAHHLVAVAGVDVGTATAVVLLAFAGSCVLVGPLDHRDLAVARPAVHEAV